MSSFPPEMTCGGTCHDQSGLCANKRFTNGLVSLIAFRASVIIDLRPSEEEKDDWRIEVW